jgi:farnesyl diphosphate synthase
MEKAQFPTMSQKALAGRIRRVAAQTEAMLGALLPDQAVGSEIMRPALLMEAMRYTALGGGKRFRPFLVVETARLFGASGSGPVRAGAAVEMIHCYSLVHDDLPAMDNDDMRRGKPTVHKAYDDAMGVLAGDGLLTLAFDVLADRRTAASAETRMELVRLLAQGAGVGGMVGGQLLDLAAEGRYPAFRTGLSPEDSVIRIQSMKTGAPIVAACMMGAVLGGATARQKAAVLRYATNLGLAFQIKDDLLDVEGDAAAVGKATGKDAAAGKATFVSLRGIEGAHHLLAEVTAGAQEALRPFRDKGAALAGLLAFNSSRTS